MRKARDPLKSGLALKPEKRERPVIRRERPAPQSLPPRTPDIEIKDAADIAELSGALLELKGMGLKLSVRILAEAPA